MKYNYIVWDYNGTIIDDAQLAVDAENVVLRECGIPEITLDFYLRECEMPIINFYKKIYDLTVYDFDELGKRFMENYDRLAPYASAFPEVCTAVKKYSKMGLRQGVISGFETNRLIKNLNKFGLSEYFDFMSGADDPKCGSKIERAAEVLKAYRYDPSQTLFIGDMYHDYETAKNAGADCVIIAKGHQGEDVLRSYGIPVIKSAEDLAEYL